MGKLNSNRRAFIRVVSGASLCLVPIRADIMAKPSFGRPMFVAGTRFYKPAHLPRAGESIRIVEGIYRGELCYAVHSWRGEMMGFIPRPRIPEVRQSAARTG